MIGTQFGRFLASTLPLAAAGAAVLPMDARSLPIASAQMFSMAAPGVAGGGGGPGGRAISRASLERYARVLGLDETQVQAADALHEAYLAGTKAAGREMASKMKELDADLKDGDSDAIQNRIPAVMRAHAEKTRQLEQTLIDDLRSVLTPQQVESRWPAFERLRLREQWLRSGVLSGSNVDLTSLVEDLKLPEGDRTRVAPTLEQYEHDMDRVLQDLARDAAESRKAERARGAGDDPIVMTFDPASMRERMKKQREDSARIRDINQRYARLLASELPDELRGRLEEQFKFASFRNVYKESPTARKLSAAEKFDDLTPAQRERLREIADGYRRQVRTANDRWAAAQAQAEADGRFAGGGGGIMFNIGDDGPGGRRQPDDLKDARQARRELDKKLDAELDGLLSDEQKARLPKVQTAGRRFGPGGEEIDILTDGEGGHAVFVSAIETAEGDGEEGVVVSRSVIVSTSEEPHDDPEAEPTKKQEKKKE